MMKVLLVEDDLNMRAHLRRALSSMPATEVVMEASSQKQATDWLAMNEGGWDLALIDMFLAEGNGFQVLKQCVKAGDTQYTDGRTREPPKAVVVSNYSRGPVHEYAQAAGAHAFFDKSLEADALVAWCLAEARRRAGMAGASSAKGTP